MCDYSLDTVISRPARAGDLLITTSFVGTISRGFSARGEPDVAVCLMPGTEVAFAKEPIRERTLSCLLKLGVGRIGSNLARFRKINVEFPSTHHDALEFSNGKIILLTALRLGQLATVLQLPVVEDENVKASAARPAVSHPAQAPIVGQLSVR